MIVFRRNLRRLTLPLWVCCVVACWTGLLQPSSALAGERPAAAVDLQAGFHSPPDAAKPWAYWWWVNGNVDEASITRDLEAMKAQGFAGLLMFDSRGYHEGHVPPPPPRMEFMSPAWRRLLKFAIGEAGRLGLQVSVNLSSGAGALKGPWDVGDDAPKKLVWTACDVDGPQVFRTPLRRPPATKFWNVALVAARFVKDDEAARLAPAEFGEKWRDAVATLSPQRPVIGPVDLSNRVDAAGQFTWEVPQGRWRLFRFGYVLMDGHENDVDILDAKAVERHFERLGRPILDDAGPLAGETLTHFYSVSWEGAAPTWTQQFEDQFQKLRGYALQPYLPVLTGLAVGSRDQSERFLRDYHKTLGDCFRDNCYGTLRELCHRAGLKWHSESGGPWNRQLPVFQHADQLAFLGRNDMPQGEFWHLGRAINRPSAMVAHIYGLPLAATEAFTHMRPHWSAYPAALKGGADAAFCDGINQLIWHTFTASPPEFGQPGIEYFAGTHVNPNVTWHRQSGPFLAYLARCQFLLRQGRPVTDLCVYTGDKAYLHWGRGEKWSEQAALAPVKGYAYDLLNTEVLLGRVAVKDGVWVLPDGTPYRLLVLDLEDGTVPVAALAKIVESTEAGASLVVGPRRPRQAPGLEGYPNSSTEIQRLNRFDVLADPPFPVRLGRGKFYPVADLSGALKAERIPPDFEGPWDFIHRQAGDVDIYFVAGTGRAECTFRVGDREPELWNPATGQIHDVVPWRATEDRRTAVTITLPEGGSVFVVFRKPATARHLVSVAGPEAGVEIGGSRPDGCRLRVWQPGSYSLQTAAGPRSVTVETLPEPKPLGGPWTVRFAPGWGAPESIRFDRLLPWNEHAQPEIKYFAGTAVYRQTFALDARQAQSLVRLQLGQVRHIAQVRVNGHSRGIVWTAPWVVDLTGAVQAGENTLEIDVTNLWVNRLIGDAGLPPEQRRTKTNILLQTGEGKFPRYRGYASTDPLEPSGLLGPVQVEFGEQRDVGL
jgi:hypothetical protein